MKKIIVLLVAFYGITAFAQKSNDVTTPLHLMKPDYPVPYGAPSKENVKAVLDKVFFCGRLRAIVRSFKRYSFVKT